MQRPHTSQLRVAAVAGHRPSLQALWLLNRLGTDPRLDLICVVPEHQNDAQAARLSSATRFVTARFRDRQQVLLDELFDGAALRRWWRDEATATTRFPPLDSSDAGPAMAALGADAVVFLRANDQAPGIAESLQRSVLVTRIGDRPVDDGMDAVMLGIVHELPDLLKATIELCDGVGQPQRRAWSGTPQIAPGDTGETILLRLTVELGEALAPLVSSTTAVAYARANDFSGAQDRSPHLTPRAMGLRTWLQYMRSEGGRHSRYVYEKAVRC